MPIDLPRASPAPSTTSAPAANPLTRSLHTDGKYKTIFSDIAVRTMSISHGKNASGPYDSTCFFIKHLPSKHEFLFFGDVEPDSVAARPRNVTVWRAAAPKIPHALSALFIECSYPAGRPDEALFGHLSPAHLVRELVALATEVVLARTARQSSSRRPRKRQKRALPDAEALQGALNGLRVYVMHCKEHPSDRPISEVIAEQCREMLETHQLGLELLTADQGMKIGVCRFLWTFSWPDAHFDSDMSGSIFFLGSIDTLSVVYLATVALSFFFHLGPPVVLFDSIQAILFV